MKESSEHYELAHLLTDVRARLLATAALAAKLGLCGLDRDLLVARHVLENSGGEITAAINALEGRPT